MAAPPPYWKKKTRPCPFYSSGRCLFSDACNFVHTVKVNHELPVAVPPSGVLRYGNDTAKPEMTPFEKSMETIKEGVITRPTSMFMAAGTVIGAENGGGTGSSSSRSSSLRRSSSERRKRVVLMSPPRSPRLSGLLSALEDVIGPDVEEVEIEESASEDEGGLEEEEDAYGPSERVDVSRESEADGSRTTSTSVPARESTSLPYYQDSPTSHDEQSLLLIDERTPPRSLPVTSSESNVENDFGASNTPHPTSVRPRIPSPIITQHLDRYERKTTVLDDNTLEVHPPSPPFHQQHLQHHLNHQSQYLHQNDDPLTPSRSSRRQSTFELLTSPFASPALRMISPQVRPISPVFGAMQGHGLVSGSGALYVGEEREGRNEKPYADDDVASLETLESSAGDESLSTRGGSSRSTSQDSLLKDAEDDRPCSVETLESSVGEHLEEKSGPSGEEVLRSASVDVSSFLSESLEEVASPQETERPSSEYFRTPKNPPQIEGVTTPELESLPPLPPSAVQNSDLDSFEMLESSGGGESRHRRGDWSRSVSQDFIPKDGSDQRSGSVDILEPSEGENLDESYLFDDKALDSASGDTSGFLTENLEEIGSPQETERPSSERFRTPKYPPQIEKVATPELESLPPPPPSAVRNNDADSFEMLGSSARGESRYTRGDSSRCVLQDSIPKDGSDQGPGSVEILESSVDENLKESALFNDKALDSASGDTPDFLTEALENLEEVGSLQETERPSSECFRSPKNPPQINEGTAEEFESSAPIPQSLTQSNRRSLSEVTLLDGEVTSSNLSVHPVEAEILGNSPSSVSHSVTIGGDSLRRGSYEIPDSVDTAEVLQRELGDLRSSRKIERSSSMSSRDAGHIREPTHIGQETQPLLSSSPSLDTVGDDKVFRQSAYASDEIDSLPNPPLVAANGEGLEESLLSPPEVETPLSPPRTGGREELKRHTSPKENSFSVLDDFIQELSSVTEETKNQHEEQVCGEQSSRIEPESSSQVSSMQPAPISTAQTESNAIDSPTSFSDDPSPVSTEESYSHTADTLVEPEVEEHKPVQETLLERRAKQSNGSISKRLTAVSVTSPTKELRDSYFPASLEKTIRPTPSPLYEDPQRSASSETTSSGASSPRQSWAELQRRSGVSQKVPFGFRQSLLVEESSSLAAKLASQFTQDETSSRTSSTSSLGFTSAAHPRPASRVDMLAGRARSTSPFAPRPSSYRHSIASQSSSAPSLRVESSANMPRSASQLEFSSSHDRSDSTDSSAPGPSRRASWMKPLRLSRVHSPSASDFRSPSSLSQNQRFSIASTHSSEPHVRNASQSSLLDKKLLSTSRSSIISAYLNDTSIPSHDSRTSITNSRSSMPSVESVLRSMDSDNVSLDQEKIDHHHSQSTGTVEQETTSNLDLLSPLSGSMRGLSFDELSQFKWPDSDHDTTFGEVTLNEDIPPSQAVAPASDRNTLIPPSSNLALAKPANINTATTTPCHAVATPRPTLMFAIASDDPTQVERVLASGEARPNDVIGPLSALEFALTNDALVNKTEIVKTLLAYGADPSGLSADLRKADKQRVNTGEEEDDVLTDLPSENGSSSLSKRKKRESVLNPAMKYYLNRAGPDAAQTSAALRRSDFRSLARMRFDFVGQDRALEHLYWVLGMHSQQPIPTPLVVLCCGPCGHGKSLLARKFGSLLEVPTHTVNMTVLKTSHDLWQCPSMSPYDPPSERTLAEFLEANEGKRCVVVLDEIDKNEDERTLWSLLAPWELGRCSIDAGRRHIDVRNVIWLGTSNIGQDLVFEHHAKRSHPDTMISKAEYRELMNALRPRVTERLGTSLMSRVTAVLPFVPFTHEEKLAIASEAILALGGECASELGPEEFERLALRCMEEYVETDGARSLYRSVSTHLMEAF